MKFSKYYNPKKKKHYKKVSRVDADIIASKAAFDDAINDNFKSFNYYDNLSDSLCKKPSREIYD